MAATAAATADPQAALQFLHAVQLSAVAAIKLGDRLLERSMAGGVRR
jgi:hypothetical protein